MAILNFPIVSHYFRWLCISLLIDQLDFWPISSRPLNYYILSLFDRGTIELWNKAFFQSSQIFKIKENTHSIILSRILKKSQKFQIFCKLKNLCSLKKEIFKKEENFNNPNPQNLNFIIYIRLKNSQIFHEPRNLHPYN